MGVHSGPVSFFLELDGTGAGRPSQVEGGLARAQTLALGNASKQIQSLEIEPVTLHCGTGMSYHFYKWIQDAFASGSYTRRNGAIVFLNTQMKPVHRMEFSDALIVDVTLPPLDKSQNREASLVVRMQPERIKLVTGTLANAYLGVYQSTKFKAWTTSNFSFEIHGLPGSEQVTAVRSIRFSQGIKKMYVGDGRFPNIEPTKQTFSDLSIELPERYGEGFLKWHEASKKPGNSATKTGSIALRAPGASSAFFAFSLRGLGIVKLAKMKSSVLQIDLFCESMEFQSGGTAIR